MAYRHGRDCFMNLLSALPITSNANIFIDLGIALVLVAFISYCCFRFKLSTKVIITTYTALTLLIFPSFVAVHHKISEQIINK